MASTGSSNSHEDGGDGGCGSRSRNHSWGSTVKSPREDGLNMPGSNPSSRRSSPRRPPSSGSSVPSPRYCTSPQASGSGSGAPAAAPDANGMRRRRNTEEWAGSEGCERVRGGCEEDGRSEEKEHQGQRRGFSGEHAVESTAATVTAVAAASRSGLLHGGDSGGYEDDFDDCFEEESEGGQQREQDTLPVRDSSSDRGGDKSTCIRNTPLVEVVYRPPSGGSRGKGERPKSAARQGRSASLNGAG